MGDQDGHYACGEAFVALKIGSRGPGDAVDG
jgi:hypothetical protein